MFKKDLRKPSKQRNKEECVIETVCGLQSLKYLLSGPLEKKIGDPCSIAQDQRKQMTVCLKGGNLHPRHDQRSRGDKIRDTS